MAGGADAAGARVAATPRLDATLARPDAARRVTITLELTPPAARVLLDGTLHEERPLTLDPSDEPHKLRIEARGHRPKQLQLTPDKDQRLVVALQPVAARRRGSTRRTPGPGPSPKPKAAPAPKPKPKRGQEGFDKL